MTRPITPRMLRFSPSVEYFKPRGVPLRQLTEVVLMPDELEALKLYEVDGLMQTEAAEQMQISQATFARILAKANRKVADALITGKAIRLEKQVK